MDWIAYIEVGEVIALGGLVWAAAHLWFRVNLNLQRIQNLEEVSQESDLDLRVRVLEARLVLLKKKIKRIRK